jgi:serine/threonine-protein kinase
LNTGGPRYQRLRAIASGGMATVYLGRALGAAGFERLVAIKVMHPHLAGNPEFVAMFLDEARLAARIRHVNVVSTLDFEEGDDGVFLVMEYIDGPSVHYVEKTYRTKGERVPLGLAVRIMLDALAGLDAAHDLKAEDGTDVALVHRDVSPQNLLVGTDGITRITDFGVARAATRLAAETQVGQVKGKYGYMSPEQLGSKPVDRRSDVYAAGVVLWGLLAGDKLFRGSSEAAVALAAATGATEPPSAQNAEVPPELDACCMKALRRNAAERYPTAAAFADALEEAARAANVGVLKHREVAELLETIDEDGPTNVRPQAVEEFLARRAAAAAAAKAAPPADATRSEAPPGTAGPVPAASAVGAPAMKTAAPPANAPATDERVAAQAPAAEPAAASAGPSNALGDSAEWASQVEAFAPARRRGVAIAVCAGALLAGGLAALVAGQRAPSPEDAGAAPIASPSAAAHLERGVDAGPSPVTAAPPQSASARGPSPTSLPSASGEPRGKAPRAPFRPTGL